MKELMDDQEYLVRMNSNAKGEHCDLYPAMSVLKVKNSPKGKEVVTRKASWIPDWFPTVVLPTDTKLKTCPLCKMQFEEDYNFLIGNEFKDVEPMCVTCFERRYIRVVDKYAYKQAIREQILKELKIK